MDYSQFLGDIKGSDLWFCIAAGCELKHEYDRESDNYRITTRYPVTVMRDGNKITVYEQRSGIRPRNN